MTTNPLLKTTLTTALLALLLAVLTAGCTGDDEGGATNTAATGGDATGRVDFSAESQPWDNQTVNVTRSALDIENWLKEKGFGLYCTRLGLKNQKVTWVTERTWWDYGTWRLWPDNTTKYDLYFKDGAPVHRRTGYFTITGTATIADTGGADADAAYQGLSLTQKLTLQTGTTVTWKSGGNDGTLTKLTIVQSKATDATLLLDGDELSIESAKSLPGARVYTVRNLPAGDHVHVLTAGSGEPGLLYLSSDIDVLAYAPYSDTTTPPLEEGCKIAFVPDPLDTKTDLLWAQDSISKSGIVYLDFHHALAQISIGTFSNEYGYDIKLKSITLSGTLNISGKLSLADGTWSGLTTGTRSISRDINLDISQDGVAINGETTGFDVRSFLLIPGTTVTIKVEFSSTEHGDESFSYTTTAEQGINKVLNTTIGENHRVDITN